MAKQKCLAQGQLGISYLWTDEGWLYLAIARDLSALPGHAEVPGHGGIHEAQGELLGSRANREWVQQFQ
ncbi:MAG: hypothetical protein JJE16_06890 [Nitrospiraceae bacterium]|nr:hypothetical protein [Nitrospiraceae bacterium]